ncbi:MAG: hypothetical protein AAGI46_14895, partial [Planctomycetota bacterium]
MTAADAGPMAPATSSPPIRATTPDVFGWFGWAWNKTFNSVLFGIILMVLLALYVAIGSGIPEVREAFEMNEMQFFNAWPMPTLAALLVVNLLTVSLNRIPFTLPRMGVWTIHLGIIVLIFGMTVYFSQKTEGLTLVRTGEQVNWYYDAHERALYLTAGKRKAEPIPLPDLPRFDPHEGAEWFADRGMGGLVPQVFAYDEATRTGRSTPLHDSPSISMDDGEPLYLDLVAFHPYAVVGNSYARGGGELTGIRMTLRASETGDERSQWLVAEQSEHLREDAASSKVATLNIRHLHRTDELTGELLASAAREAHEVSWRVGGEDPHTGGVSGTITIEPGERVALDDTGYELEAVAFLPGFPLFGNGEPVDAFELLVHPPADSPHGKTFRRYLLDERHSETDFVLGVEGAGPKGQRQETLVDETIHLHYDLADGLDLLPKPGEDERHTLLTKSDRAGFWHVVTRADQPTRLEDLPDGKLELAVNGQRRDPESGIVTPMTLDLDLERVDEVRHSPWVREVPSEQRDRDAAMAGTFQVVTIRARRGDWEQTVHVPFSQWIDQMAWQPAAFEVPGMAEPLRLQLGNTRKEIPARVRLDAFELVPYAGDFTKDSAMRDFRSLLTVDPRGGEPGGVT